MRDVLIVCCDGLTGLAEAIEATLPQVTVQTCVVHLIRAATRFVSYKDRKAVCAGLRPVYQAANEEAAMEALDAFDSSELGQRYPAVVKTFTDAWDRFVPFLSFPPMLRRVIHTTNSIESLNYRLRKVTQEPGPLPLPTRPPSSCCGWRSTSIENRRTRQRDKEKGATSQQTKSTRPTHRGSNNHQLETSPPTAGPGLPGTNQPPPLTTMTANAYTKYLTLILETAAEGMTRNLADGPAQVSVFALICLPLGGAGASGGRG